MNMFLASVSTDQDKIRNVNLNTLGKYQARVGSQIIWEAVRTVFVLHFGTVKR